MLPSRLAYTPREAMLYQFYVSGIVLCHCSTYDIVYHLICQGHNHHESLEPTLLA